MFRTLVLLIAGADICCGEQMTEAEANRERYTCGARAAFALARIMNHDVTYKALRDHARPSEQGTSLADVQKTLKMHGVECAVLRLQLTDLVTLPCPFILHTVPIHSAPVRESFRRVLPVGHFIVVTDVDEIGLHTIDPMTNYKRHWRWESLGDQWAGYAIAPTPAMLQKYQTLLFYLLITHLLLAVLVAGSLWQAHRTNDAMDRSGEPVLSAIFSLRQNSQRASEG